MRVRFVLLQVDLTGQARFDAFCQALASLDTGVALQAGGPGTLPRESDSLGFSGGADRGRSPGRRCSEVLDFRSWRLEAGGLRLACCGGEAAQSADFSESSETLSDLSENLKNLK